MDRLGNPATDDSSDRLLEASIRLGQVIQQLLAAVVVLGIFIGLAALTYVGRIPADPVILYAGVILGYLLHAIKDLI